jgi:hypothetical protein
VRLDVPVNDPALVGHGQYRRDLRSNPGHPEDGKRSLLGDEIADRIAVHELHYQEEPAVIFTGEYCGLTSKLLGCL